MSRTKRKRPASHARRLERRALGRELRELNRQRYVYGHAAYEVAIIAAQSRDFSTEGLVVCETCGTCQPAMHSDYDENGEVRLAPCLRGLFLGLPCPGESSVTLETYAEAA